MPAWMNTLLELAAQVTGGRGGVDNIIVHFVIAAGCFGSLLAVALAKYRHDPRPRERLLIWGFGLGLARELFMILAAVVQALGWVAPVRMHMVFPPLEHAIRSMALITVAAAYLRYLLDDPLTSRRYLQAGIGATLLAYLVTFMGWAHYIQAHPTSSFGKTWNDLLFHANASVWNVLAAAILATKTRGWVRNVVMTAMVLFFTSDFIKIIDILLGEVYEAVFTPFGRLAYLVAIPLLGYVYVRETALDLKRHTESLETEVHARAAAEQMARARSDFLAAMSHEIRTPMNGVVGISQLLSTTVLDERQRGYLRVIEQSAEATLRVLNDVLDYTRFEAGRLEMERVPFDPATPAQDCQSLFSFQALQSGVPLVVELTDLPPTVQGDPLRLRQVLINLVGNAYKFTPEGRISLRASARLETDGQATLRFEVADTGIGMTDAQQSRVFDEFTQADASIARRYGGSGLGLAICRLLVTMMGGEIGVRSVLGTGSVFWFTVPVPVVPTPDAGATGAAVAAVDHPVLMPANRALRALVVEDNETNRLVIKSLLDHLGLESHTVDDGAQAVDLVTVQHSNFDVVFMDLEMQNMNGIAATQRIRAWERAGARAPMFICGLSAHALQEHRERALDVGMNDYVTKPLRTEELRRVVRDAVAHRDATGPSSQA